MSNLKKDHSLGAGTGAIGGAVAGAVAGSVVAGPLGTVVGAVAGGVVGAKAGDAIAEAINPTDYNRYFRSTYQDTPYYSSGREWNDYEPAYRYGYDSYSEYRGQRFEDVQDILERNWEASKANSRLAWAEAKGAVRDGWQQIERSLPGDVDRDRR